MLRSIGAVIAGVLAGACVIFVVEGAGHIIFPTPEGVNLKDPAGLKAIMSFIPLGAKLSVIIAWFAGVFAGGVVSLFIGLRWAPIAWLVAGTLFAMAALSMTQIPHPWWMMFGAVAATIFGAVGAIGVLKADYKKPAPPGDIRL